MKLLYTKRSTLLFLLFYFILNFTYARKIILVSNYKEVKISDSARAIFVDNGNSFVREEGINGEYAEGNYKNKLKSGTWKGVQGSNSNKISFVEEYENGKLISGVSTDVNGKKHSYVVEEEVPEYPGGTKAIMKFIGKKFKYPKEAQKKGVKGEIIIQFIVDKEGNVTDASILEDVGYGCGEEGVRVIESLKKWKPGIQRGRPVRVQFSVPISLHLDSK